MDTDEFGRPRALSSRAFERFSLAGRGIGITGGGGHLGAALALGVAEVGAIAVICGRNADRLRLVVEQAKALELMGRVVAEPADVGCDDDIDVVLDRIEQETGAVDGWVNNAYHSSASTLLNARRDDIGESLKSGLVDPVVATQLAAKRMMVKRAGSVVNVASMYALVSPDPRLYKAHPEYHNPPAYGAAKAGVLQFTRYAACHLAPLGIRVNAVSPGPFPRPSVSENDDFSAELVERVPLGRLGKPDDLVGAVVFLLSNASSYVTGCNILIDGGWTAW